MSLSQFDNGYWYATELKKFADSIGIQFAARLRKDELERAIKRFLQTGKTPRVATPKRSTSVERDVDRGLHLNRRVVRYTNDAATKDFLEHEAKKIVPGFRRRSGVRYRLNRWRDAQLASGVAITYRDVVEEYVRLNQSAQPFARIPHGRYINFLADFLSHEPRAKRNDAIAAWHALKTMDCPKTYSAWRKARSKRPR